MKTKFSGKPKAQEQPDARNSPDWLTLCCAAVTLLCLITGMACRFYGLNWDEGAQLHPDERFCISLVPRLAWPHHWSEFFDASRSPLNPDNLQGTHYFYGQLPLFLLLAAQNLTHYATSGAGMDVAALLRLGRFMAALFDCGTVGFSYLIARRLLDGRAALVAAALVAGAALHVQQSHFFVTDPFAAFFLTASFWAGARLIENRKWPDAALCGALFGAALACKISAALFGAALLGVFFVLARRGPARQTAGCLYAAALAALLVFRVGHPMAFRGEAAGGLLDLWPEPRFWSDIHYQSAITSGEVDVPFNVQWIGRAPILFSLRNLGFWGYGWPFLLSAAGGLALLARRPRGHAVLAVGALFGLLLLGVWGAAFSKFTRYFLPMTPFAALLAAHFWRQASARHPIWGLGAPLVALSAALWSVSVASVYGRTHTRLQASRWIEENIAPGTFVANETPWDEGLPLGGTLALNSVNLETFEPDTPRKRALFGAKLDAAQWIFLSSGRSWQNIPRWPQKWPMMTPFYRALFDGSLGFRLEKRFTAFPRLGRFEFPDVGAEEALTVYDHPVVLLFRKTPAYNSFATRAILGHAVLPAPRNWSPRQAPSPNPGVFPVPPGV